MKTIIIYAILFSFAVFLNCTTNNNLEEDLSGKKIFRYNESAGITTLDPAKVWRFEDFIIVNQLYNCLVTLDDEMKIIPALAKSWEISENGLQYTFNLKKNVCFHNHTAFKSKRFFKSKDVQYSFMRIIDPQTASPGKYIFNNISFDSVSNYKGILALNDTTVIIYLKEPQPSFLYQLSLPNCAIVPFEIVDYYGANFGQNPIGTGPFFLKKWKADAKLIMLKNEEYFEKDDEGISLPYIDAISLSFINDQHVEFIQLKSGKLDMISGFNDNDKDELLDQDGNLHENLKSNFYLQKKPWINTEYLGFLLDEEFFKKNASPLAKKQVRQAISHCIDKYKLIKYVRNGIGKPAYSGLIPIGMPEFNDVKIDGLEYDIDKAKKLLIEAGFPNGKGLPIIQLKAAEGYRTLCEFIQASCSDIGIKVDIDLLKGSVLNQHITQFEATFYRKSWIADFPDAINYFQLFYSKNFHPNNGLNYTHFKNENYDKYYELSLKENNEEIRYNYYKEMQIILNEELPVIPLFYAETLRFVSNRVSGLSSNALNMLNLKTVKLAD
jgi:oligopeptide transport system substrate-binding protein